MLPVGTGKSRCGRIWTGQSAERGSVCEKDISGHVEGTNGGL